MRLPDDIRTAIRDRIWRKADELGWNCLTDTDRSHYYGRWTTDSEIGGQLAHFMDPRKVRVYIKDTLLKPYERERLLANQDQVWLSLGLPAAGGDVVQTYIKPHGCRLSDGKVVCWGNSRDWKLVLMAVFERARMCHDGVPYGAVLFETGPTSAEATRTLVRDAGSRLGLKQLVWPD